jgi:hypothetical protein
MTSKPRVVVDPHFRTMQEIFSSADLARLHAIVEVIFRARLGRAAFTFHRTRSKIC